MANRLSLRTELCFLPTLDPIPEFVVYCKLCDIFHRKSRINPFYVYVLTKPCKLCKQRINILSL